MWFSLVVMRICCGVLQKCVHYHIMSRPTVLESSGKRLNVKPSGTLLLVRVFDLDFGL